MALALLAPVPLNTEHRLSDFNCGESSLNDWLKRRALANQHNGASRTFVVTDRLGEVYGYYALAAGAVSHNMASNSIKRNMPDPIPVMVLGRLAVDFRAQGIKLGASLLKDAVTRSTLVAQHIGVRAILVHAINDRAKQFYELYGFKASTIDPLVLMLKL
ncbi:MAG: GNAT family N-acetyltransferase [Gammaproteobacteria bacterium]|nr:GNAT family N-acetyltransferase [Gammaproteobacteria bacterium]